EDGREVRLDHRPPVVVGHAREQAIAGEARVVDEDVEVAGLLDETRRLFGARNVGLHGASVDLARQCVRLLGAGAVAHHDLGPAAGELLRDRAADSFRRARDEGSLALERAEGHGDSESSSGSRSSASMLLTETALTLRSIRLTRPVSTLPGPT